MEILLEEVWKKEDLRPFKKPSDGKGNGEGTSDDKGTSNNADSKGSEPGDKSDQQGAPGDLPSEQDIEDHIREIEKKISGRSEIQSTADADKKIADLKKGQKSTASDNTTSKRVNDTISEFDYANVVPKMRWKPLLNKMVATPSTPIETYQKPHRRSIAGVFIGAQTGSYAIKPAELPEDGDIKLAFIVDSSGSMNDVIDKIYANLHQLLKKIPGVNTKTFYLIKFSDGVDIYVCSMDGNRYAKVNDITPKSNVTAETGKVSDLFKKTFGGGTNFNEHVVGLAKDLVKKKFNVLVLSDSDLMYGANFTHFAYYLQKIDKKMCFAILDSRDTFVQLCKQMKQVPHNATYFE